MYVQYGSTLYKSNSLRKAAELALKLLPEEVKVLVSTGSSGNSIAAAMLALSDRELYHTVIRKETDTWNHGSNIAEIGCVPQEYREGVYIQTIAAFVDDFISSGITLNAVLRKKENSELLIKYAIVGEDTTFSKIEEFRNMHDVKVLVF